ncbi:MAG: HAMP domain-containing sensor histidine kinase [Halanaerobiales bacterium]
MGSLFNKYVRGPKTLSWKIAFVYALMFILVLLLLNGSIFLIVRNYVGSNARQSLQNTIEYITPRLRGLESGQLYLHEADFLEDITRTEGDIYFRILNYKQEVVFQPRFLRDVDVPVELGFKKMDLGERQVISRTLLLTNYGSFSGYLQVVRDVTLENKFLDFLFTVLLVTSAVGSIVAVIIGYFTTRKTLEPIEEITSTARSLSVSDLGERLEIAGPEDELTDLARTFNSMLGRLEKAFSRQQEFVSDASHELRTPVSVIKGYIDLLDRWGKHEEEIRDEAINAIKNEVSNINHLLENLLFLARGESDNIEINKEEFVLDEILTDVIDETRMLADEIEITSEIEEGLKFYGDRKMIKQLVRIFVDNSIKYTSSGGRISVSLDAKEKYIKINVADTGCGIPQEDLPHIFERFYRVDKSRSSSGEKGGSGLGLSIARWIIDVHEGKVEVDSEVGKGTTITVLFPHNID